MIDEIKYDVVGAGKLIISESANVLCGGKTGFHFGVTWGQHGEAGGVLPQEEAYKLAQHILTTLRKEKIKNLLK